MASERIIIKGTKGSIFFEKDSADDGTYETSKELKLNAGNTAIEFDGSDIGAAGGKGQKGDTSFLGGAGGDKGYKGTTGPQGDKGQKGDLGPQGNVGVKGPAGPQGGIGPIGNVGTKGQKCERGAYGDTGSKGQKGVVGKGNNVVWLEDGTAGDMVISDDNLTISNGLNLTILGIMV